MLRTISFYFLTYQEQLISRNTFQRLLPKKQSKQKRYLQGRLNLTKTMKYIYNQRALLFVGKRRLAEYLLPKEELILFHEMFYEKRFS